MSEERGKSGANPEPQVSTLAVWSLVCGTFFFLPPLGLLALVLSPVARRRIRRSQGRLVGYRIAGVGLGLGITSIAFVCFAVMALPGFGHASSRQACCRSNLKMVGFCILMYENDHESNGRPEMPPDLWALVQEGYMKDPESVLLCPDATAQQEAPHGSELRDSERRSDFAYARLIDPDGTPASAPISWDKYLHAEWRFWHWRGRACDSVNVLKQDGTVSWMPMADLTAFLAQNRALYESIPPLPVFPDVPRGWNAVEYAAAAAVAFYSALILVALFRRRWLYALLPDRPSDAPGTQALTTGLPTE